MLAGVSVAPETLRRKRKINVLAANPALDDKRPVLQRINQVYTIRVFETKVDGCLNSF